MDCSRFMLFDATFIETINLVAKELNDHNVILVLQSLSLKQQRLLTITPNIKLTNDSTVTLDDLLDHKLLLS